MSNLLPLLSQFIPPLLASKGLSRVNPKIGTFINSALGAGYGMDSILSYLRTELQNPGEAAELSRLENGARQGTLRPDEMASLSQLKQANFAPNVAQKGISLATGGIAGKLAAGQQQPEETKATPDHLKYLQENHPNIFSKLQQHLSRGTKPNLAAAAIRTTAPSKIIKAIEKDTGKDFIQLIEDLFPQQTSQSTQQRPSQQPQAAEQQQTSQPPSQPQAQAQPIPQPQQQMMQPQPQQAQTIQQPGDLYYSKQEKTNVQISPLSNEESLVTYPDGHQAPISNRAIPRYFEKVNQQQQQQVPEFNIPNRPYPEHQGFTEQMRAFRERGQQPTQNVPTQQQTNMQGNYRSKANGEPVNITPINNQISQVEFPDGRKIQIENFYIPSIFEKNEQQRGQGGNAGMQELLQGMSQLRNVINQNRNR